jgi:hypothetical protein
VIKVEILYNILRDWDPDLDLDEVECLLADQIFNGLIKGYVSHERRLLVLAKQIEQAFPLKA